MIEISSTAASARQGSVTIAAAQTYSLCNSGSKPVLAPSLGRPGAPFKAAAIEVAGSPAYFGRPEPERIQSLMNVRSVLDFLTGRREPGVSVPQGQRLYAVGDVHGRLDLLDALLDAIAADDAGRPPRATTIIFLGDLIDRGPDSRGVVERLLALSRGATPTRFLMGNHEQVFLRALEGDVQALRFLIRIGGRETLLSYGIGEAEYRALDYEDLIALAQRLVPEAHRAFLAGFEPWIEVGDYLFVHAGVRPGIAIEEQSTSDLCWIRDEFLRHRDSFGKMVVHGHSITHEVDLKPNRIGIDTGAFASGRLTAIGLDGEERWFLST